MKRSALGFVLLFCAQTMKGIGFLLFLCAQTSAAQSVGNCEIGTATKDLDVNNVGARLYNTGSLFWRGFGNYYRVPKDGNASAIFNSGLWIGGLANGDELRMAATVYGPWQFWPGPLDANGNPPPDCAPYDRLYSVDRRAVEAFRATGALTDDIRDWPGALGAAFVDVNGDGRYATAAGDYPDLIGDQMVWWVMNDAGNINSETLTAPMGLEVQVTAFAFDTRDALDNTTFYRYKVIYKGSDPLLHTYLGFYSDADLGDASDDFIGSDTLLGMGYTYNGDDFDEGSDGYGDRPPALGYEFVQGPLVPSPGDVWIDPGGRVHPDSTRLRMTTFFTYFGDSSVIGNPSMDTMQPYLYLQAIWRDGRKMTVGGNGYGGSEETNFMYPGDPVEKAFWSEENTDGRGSRNTPSDRRFLISTGPFDLYPGDEQEIVLAIIWSRGLTRLGSVARLKQDAAFVQGQFNANFEPFGTLDAPDVVVDALDRSVSISWSNPETSTNYLGAFDVRSPYLVDQNPPDGNTTFSFEGYRLYRFDSSGNRELIATFDVRNGVGLIYDDVLDHETGFRERRLVAAGSDAGIQSHAVVGDLINHRTYTFGIEAYAYNPHSNPKVINSPITTFTATPADPAARGVTLRSAPGDVLPAAQNGEPVDATYATVTGPGLLTGHVYEIRFFGHNGLSGYDVFDATTGETNIDGRAFIDQRGRGMPFGENVVSVDGLSFTIAQPEDADPVLSIDTAPYAPVAEADAAKAAVANIGIVPNPYRGTSAYEVDATTAEVRFTNLPDRAVVRVFTLGGSLVREMELSTFDNTWELRNDKGHAIASGLYLVHVEVPGIGEKILKFGVVKKRIRD